MGFAWLSLDFLREPDDRIRVLLFVDGAVAVLAEGALLYFLQVSCPLIDEVEGFYCLDVELLTSLQHIIDHDGILSLKILQVAAGCNDLFERKHWHAVLGFVCSQIILKLQVN